jgi:beta-glucanase (GH16 family)
MPVPLGRWFEVRVHLYQGNRIEWYVNGSLFDTSYNSTYPVGRFYPVSTGWVMGFR